MTERPALHALAERLGIVPAYRDTGQRLRATPDSTREALLGCMGIDASSEEAAARALSELERRERERPLEPVAVATAGRPEAQQVRLMLPGTEPVDWSLELRAEDDAEAGGERAARGAEGGAGPWRAEGRSAPEGPDGLRALTLPRAPGPGVYRLELALDGAGQRLEAGQRRIVAPERCVGPDERPGRPCFGLIANLYSLRRRGDLGFGDFGALRGLVELTARTGGDFVGLNPLHALWNQGGAVSPYLPVSRLFRNPLYLELEAIPEWEECEEARGQLASPPLRAERARLHALDRVEQGAVLRLLRPLLERLHRHFAERHRDRDDPRGRAYARYRAREGEPLDRFASFAALAEHLGEGERPAADWRRWPEAYQSPTSARVARFRQRHAEAVDFQRWLQFELDRQLGAAAERARDAGLGIGLYTDLALGSAGSGSDSWSFPGLAARGASAGAPPDDFAPEGQSWGFPPLDPRALREDGYEFWIRLLRSGFRHAGALRIDHAMSLTRLFWVPDGRPAREGAYVRYPEAELLAILALESRRHRALVIGEDLGTVPTGFAERLAERGVLSSRVLYFERRGEDFEPASAWSGRALATANTHDLPTLAGYGRGADLELRRRVGLLEDDAALEAARAERTRDFGALCRRLHAEGLLPDPADEPSTTRLAAAVSAFLGRTPSPLVGLAVDDLAGEPEPVNLPGASQEVHPSWTRRLAPPVEELGSHPVARAALAALPDARRRPRDGATVPSRS